MSELLSAELAATCSALGYYDQASKKYFGDNDTLETVKDLIRYLRRDDENHDIRRQLGNAKVLQTDLLPMLKSYWEETELFDVLLRLLVNLTTPAITLWNEEIPKDKITRNYYIQIEDHLKNYKEAFADQDVWSALSRRLSKILEIDYGERGDENSLIIERILILLRNVLFVPIEPYLERPDDDASVHDQVLWALHQSGMLDIILYMSSSSSEQAYYIHIVEILYFMLREQRAKDLASAGLQRSETEKLRDEAELLAIKHREAYEKQEKMKKYAGARHSRFGGTFVVKSMKSISNNELIYHKPLSKLAELNFDAEKKKVKTPKNRLPISGTSYERRSAFSIRLFLKEFCIDFLNGAYNTFMNYVKHALVRGQTQDNDASYYLWAMRFFMEMNCCYKFDIRLVSETMSLQSFHHVQREMEKYFDMMYTDKKNVKPIAKRLHLALLAYRQLLYTLCAMDKSSDESVRSSSRVIKSNLFYVPEYRELLITLLITFDELKSSFLYLNDLIETQHIFFKLLDKFCSSTGGVVVRQTTKKKKKKPVNKSKPQVPPINLDAMWDEISTQLSVILESGDNLNSDEAPFDAASDIPIDEQKTNAMRNIQRKLRNGEFESAVGLLYASRNVWPENDEFGNSNMTNEEEFMALKDIFFANINDQEQNADVENQEEEESEDNEEDDCDDIAEKEYKIEDFIKRLAHPKVVRACGLSLKNFKQNKINTNLCAIKLLHRIAFDCKMYVMVFQLSIFRIFQQIFKVKELPQYKELVKFAVYIIRQFFKVAEKNKKIYIETLFWKSNGEAYEIEEGYGCTQKKSAIKIWTEQDEDELRRLFMEHREKQIEEDVVDWIVDNLIDNTRSRRSVLKKLKEMMLITDQRSKSSVRATRIWTPEEEAQLEELYNQFKDANDPVGCIMERMNVRRSKPKIVEKLLILGLIRDKSEVRKKRVKKSEENRNIPRGNDSEVSEISDNGSLSEDSDSNDDTSKQQSRQTQIHPNTTTKQQRKTTKKPKKQKTANKQEAIKLLLDLSSERSDALEWLKESFSDAVEDMNDCDEEDRFSLPLVPIMDHAVEAVENTQFQQLLRAMGLTEPFEGQEIYWRIPSTISLETLTEYIELLTQAIDKTLEMPKMQESSQLELNTESNVMPNLVEQVFKKKHSNLRLVVGDSDSEPEYGPTELEVTSSNHESNMSSIVEEVFRKKHNGLRLADSDSEDETLQEKNASEIGRSNSMDDIVEQVFKKKHGGLQLIDSESEDETEQGSSNGLTHQTANVTSVEMFESTSALVEINNVENVEAVHEEKKNATRRKRVRQVVDSDSEDDSLKGNNNDGIVSAVEEDTPSELDAPVHKKRPSKRLKIIDSDDED